MVERLSDCYVEPLWNNIRENQQQTWGWHNHINWLAGRPHPNINQLIDLIKKEDDAYIVTLQQIQTGGLIVSKKKISLAGGRKASVAQLLTKVILLDVFSL
jgi:hypothetical protein